MLKIYLTPNILDNELEQTGSVVEIATDPGFNHMTYASGENYQYLTVHMINMELVPGTTYYARARLIYNYGLSDWQEDTFVAIAGDVDELKLYPIQPVRCGQPQIVLDFDSKQHPTVGFRIHSVFDISIENPIVSTTWLIEDVFGKPVLYVNESDVDLISITIGDHLKKNSLYVIKCRHRLKSGDSTLFGSRVIYTSGDRAFRLLPDLIIKSGSLYELTYTRPLYQISIEFDILNNDTVVLSGTSISSTIDITPLLEYDAGRYIVRARAIGNSKISNWEYYLVVIDHTGDKLPYALPHVLGGSLSGNDPLPHIV